MHGNPSPVVSAVIPTRNRPDIVVRAVRSVLAQTFSGLEVVVVVDGPDPATVAALEALCDKRVRAVVLEASVGGAEARNIGVRTAHGNWIAFLDDDDEWLPRKIERQLAAGLESRHPHTLVVSRFICRSEREDRIRPRRMPFRNEPICEYMFDFLCYFQTSTYFCSRSLLTEVPFRRMPGFQDIDWFLRANSHQDVGLVTLDDVLSVYYAPEDRQTITAGLSLEKRLAWGRANRNSMTKRAYSRFLVGSCIGRAVEENVGVRALAKLFGEFIFAGAPSFSGIVLFFGMCVVTPPVRRRIRNRFFLVPFQKTAERQGVHV